MKNSLEQINTPEQPEMKWRQPTLKDLYDEQGEIERVARSFLSVPESSANYEMTVKKIAECLLVGEYVPLDDELWSQLENTDSYKYVEPGDLDTCKILAAKYGKDFEGILKTVQASKDMPSPTILKYKD